VFVFFFIMEVPATLIATQRVLTLAILLLHSVSYILVILSLTLLCVFHDYMTSYNASYATVLSSIVVLTCRHEYRRVFKHHGQASKTKAMEKKARPVRLLTYNLFCRPPLVRNNADDYKNERLELFLQEIEQYDIIALQEIFELLNTRQKYLIRAARKVGFKYSLRGTWPSFDRKFIDAGVLILSKHPIMKYDHHIFESATEVDQFAAKQMMYAGVSVEGKMVHVFTTHTQATYGNNDGGAPKSGNPIYEWGQTVIKGGMRDANQVTKECDEARVGQIRESRAFIDKVLDHGKVLGENDIAVLMADLNVDALNSPEEYSALLDTLSNGSGYHVSNAFYDQHGFHPVTYGDVCPKTGENLETTLTAPMDCGMKGSLDYLMVLRREKEKAGVKGFDSPYRVEDVQVEPFFVKEKQEKPITQLSDHYGVSAVLVPH
jgi:endonuclease/exonuclease/phosphatase family metal-dependent hydrolase